jgi:hypothetical protein
MDELIATIDRLDAASAARRPQDGGWTPAQIGWHVATTNDLLGGVISGSVPMATPAPEGYTENGGAFSGIPAKVQTFPQLEPPAAVTREEALTRLRASKPQFVSVVQGLEGGRATGYCVQFPFGLLSMYQLAEFAAKHATRHLGQIERVVAGV